MNHLVKTLSFLLVVNFLFSSCSRVKDEGNDYSYCMGLINNKPASDPNNIFVPTAFTPNGDGRNDHFKTVSSGSFTAYSFKVWDSNSNLVFESTTINQAWNYVPSSMRNEIFYFRVEATTQLGNQIGICDQVSSLICIPSGRSLASYKFEDQITPLGFTGVTSETLANCP